MQPKSKKWKMVKLISAIAIIIGIYVFLLGLPKGGFQNPITGAGFSLAFLGLIGLVVGKFATWWND